MRLATQPPNWRLYTAGTQAKPVGLPRGPSVDACWQRDYLSGAGGIPPWGVYREYFRPVADGVRWMNDLGLYLDFTVP